MMGNFLLLSPSLANLSSLFYLEMNIIRLKDDAKKIHSRTSAFIQMQIQMGRFSAELSGSLGYLNTQHP